MWTRRSLMGITLGALGAATVAPLLNAHAAEGQADDDLARGARWQLSERRSGGTTALTGVAVPLSEREKIVST
mgnify:CR=1 FL=1